MLREVPPEVLQAETPRDAAQLLANALRASGVEDVEVWSPARDQALGGPGVWRVLSKGTRDPRWGARLCRSPGADRCRWGSMESPWGRDITLAARDEEA